MTHFELISDNNSLYDHRGSIQFDKYIAGCYIIASVTFQGK